MANYIISLTALLRHSQSLGRVWNLTTPRSEKDTNINLQLGGSLGYVGDPIRDPLCSN